MKDEDGGSKLPQTIDGFFDHVKQRMAANPAYRRNGATYPARCAEWAKHDYWSADEAASLLVGTDPQRPSFIEGQDELNREVSALRAAITRADITVKGAVQKRYKAKEVMAWAARHGITIPDALSQAMGLAPKNSADKPVHGNTLANAENHKAVLGAAVVALIKYPAQCKGQGDKYTGTSIARVLEQQQAKLFKDKVAPLEVRTMAEIINTYLSPLKE